MSEEYRGCSSLADIEKELEENAKAIQSQEKELLEALGGKGEILAVLVGIESKEQAYSAILQEMSLQITSDIASIERSIAEGIDSQFHESWKLHDRVSDTLEAKTDDSRSFASNVEVFDTQDGFFKLTAFRFRFRSWLPTILPHAVSFACNMFFVSLFSPGIELYIYPKGDVDLRILSLFSPIKTIPDAFFIACYNILFFVGDTSGRRIFQSVKATLPPYFFLIFNMLGAACGLSTIPEITIFGGFFIALGNGALYVQSCNWIETSVDPEYHLMSFSFWLFVGDFGATTGNINNVHHFYSITVDE